MGKTNKLHPVEVFDTLGIRSAVEHLQNSRDFGKEKLLLAVFAVKKVKPLMQYKGSIDALDMAERMITGDARSEDIQKAYCAALDDENANNVVYRYGWANEGGIAYIQKAVAHAASNLINTNYTWGVNIQWIIDSVIDAIYHHALTEHNKEWGKYIAKQAVEQLWADVETKFIEIFKGETK